VQQKARTFIFSVAKQPPVNLSVTEATRNKHQIADGATLEQSVGSARNRCIAEVHPAPLHTFYRNVSFGEG
jgi:hypothetical protein